MKESKLIEILEYLYLNNITPEEAWKIIDRDREVPNEYSKEYWLPIRDYE